MNKSFTIILLILVVTSFLVVNAQNTAKTQAEEQCGTMARLAARLDRNPALKTSFNQQLEIFNRKTSLRGARPQNTEGVADVNAALYTIPVIFHIVLNNPAVVTDAQIQLQLDILNKNFAGSGADSVNIPVYFKPFFGKSGIQFCLAQRTPQNESSTGIDRVITTKTFFSNTDDAVKHTSAGGVNLWDGDKYLNIWVCSLNDVLLGYGTFPADGQPDEQGVVIDYRSMPGGSFSNFNGGKTLSHEIGHYFNLFHIWGNDDGACTGSDFVDDTPNQGNSTTGCFTGVKTDNCTPGGNGILYQDYMDYSYDQCMLLFTKLQADRMVNALLTYRSSLITSNACTSIATKALDAKLITIDAPGQRICANNFSPVVTIDNRGSKTLTSLVIRAVIDNGSPVNYNWVGILNPLATATVTLNSLIVSEGTHGLKIFVSSPNKGIDENNSNDTLTTNFEFYGPVATVTEGFEGGAFPPPGWDIVNADQSITWQKVTGIAKSGNASVMIDNFDYSNTGQQDYLRLPELNLVNIDSAYLSFQLAANTFSGSSNSNGNLDTLEVLLSKDCGATYASLYKKWGASLVTSATAANRAFVPVATDWRKDSINISAYINTGAIILAFKNTTGFENNIYLDDINIKTQIINPNLKASGFLITPNPASSNISVQFYPNPINLRSIQLYSMLGQKLAETNISAAQGATAYNFNVSRYPAGTYVVRVVFANKVLTKRFIKN